MKLKSWKTVAIIIFPLQWLIFSFVSRYPDFIETIYSTGIYPVISYVLRLLTGWIPFSAGEIAVYSLVCYMFYTIFKICNKFFKGNTNIVQTIVAGLINIISYSSLAYLLFMVFWGMNYHRVPLIQEISKNYNSDELIQLCDKLAERVNSERCNLDYKILEEEQIIDEAKSLFTGLKAGDKELNINHPVVKKILFTNLFSYLGVTGIYNPFTGEANVNAAPPPFLLPATVCHELAHQAGIAPEQEANYVAFLACRRSENHFFKYSGYLMAMRYAFNYLKKYDKNNFKKIRERLNEKVLSDLRENSGYWSKFKNPLEKYTDKVYDSYLKANDRKEGIAGYGMMVGFLLYEYRNKGEI